jgi:menaquinone-specific isochorismate synthase
MSLHVVTKFAAATTPSNPSMVFLRDGNLMFGEGIALRITAKGKNRIGELSQAWKELAKTSQIHDEVKLWGSGLVAFTSISFSPLSGFESALVVPARLTVIREGVNFVTEVSRPVPTSKAMAPVGEFSTGELSPQEFVTATEKAISRIQQTELEKVVLARDLVLELDAEPDLMPAIQRLHARYPHCWTYLVEDHFGASPELLLRAEAGQVSARVLAGTAGRGTDPDVDRAIADGLLHSSKNQHEHSFAVQSLLLALGDYCQELEADDKPFSLALPDLWHLATDVKGLLKPGLSLLDAVSALHPTAAVAGTPTQLALKTIDELEPFDRGGYAGPVGWVSSDGSGELAIALRGGRVERDPFRIRAFAGGGIVQESDPEAELAETELKFRAVKYAFGS